MCTCMYVLYVKKKQCPFPYSYIAKLYCFEEPSSPNYLFSLCATEKLKYFSNPKEEKISLPFILLYSLTT